MQGMRDLAELARELARCAELDTQLQLVCDRLCSVEGIAHTAITDHRLREQPILFISRGTPEALERIAIASASMPDEAIKFAMPDLKLRTRCSRVLNPPTAARSSLPEIGAASLTCEDALAGAAGLVHLCVSRQAAAMARRSELRAVEALLENMHNIMVYQGTPGDGQIRLRRRCGALLGPRRGRDDGRHRSDYAAWPTSRPGSAASMPTTCPPIARPSAAARSWANPTSTNTAMCIRRPASCAGSSECAWAAPDTRAWPGSIGRASCSNHGPEARTRYASPPANSKLPAVRRELLDATDGMTRMALVYYAPDGTH
jgi:hypothetical protein